LRRWILKKSLAFMATATVSRNLRLFLSPAEREARATPWLSAVPVDLWAARVREVLSKGEKHYEKRPSRI